MEGRRNELVLDGLFYLGGCMWLVGQMREYNHVATSSKLDHLLSMISFCVVECFSYVLEYLT